MRVEPVSSTSAARIQPASGTPSLSSLAAVAALSMFVSGAAFAQTYNATRDFSSTWHYNPNKVWSYGYVPASDSGAYTFKRFEEFFEADSQIVWRDPVHQISGTPAFWKNLGDATVDGVKPGQISLHPGPDEGPTPHVDAAVLRFTAPAAGRYHVQAQFMAGDSGQTEAWIVRSRKIATPLAHFATTSSNPRWDRTVHLNDGQVLDFVVGHATDSFASDNTPLTVVITTEPFAAQAR